jgi:hemolysin III
MMSVEPALAEGTGTPDKPSMRGMLHLLAFLFSIPAGVLLIASAGTTTARVAAAVYAVGLAGLFGASAAYHTLPWTETGRVRMKRLDHSMIYVLIAGTYTPFALLVVEGPWGVGMLVVVWFGAILGITLKLVRIDGFRATAGTLYIVLGWIAILALPAMIRDLSVFELVLVFAGAASYTLGSIVLLRRKPDPSPKTFGYHEVWHTAVIAACVCFYLVTFSVVSNA